MQDTLQHTFVLFSCDDWTIAGTFTCTSSLGLAEHLAGHHEMFGASPSLSWRRLARRTFSGRPVFFTAGSGGYLLLAAPTVAFYRVGPGRMVQTDADVWTWYDHLANRGPHPEL